MRRKGIWFTKREKADYAKLMYPYRARVIDDLRNGIEYHNVGVYLERDGKHIFGTYTPSAVHQLETEGVVYWQDGILKLSEDYK